MTGSNRRPSACKADALPAELITLRFGVGASYTKNPQCLVLYAIYLKYFSAGGANPVNTGFSPYKRESIAFTRHLAAQLKTILNNA
jgi:hypothetical protein